MPITLVLDNARYQKRNIVTALALKLNIELLYLFAYSPNVQHASTSPATKRWLGDCSSPVGSPG